MTFEERLAYVKRPHKLGIATVAKYPTENMFRASAAHDQVLANTSGPGQAWVRVVARRARTLLKLGQRSTGRQPRPGHASSPERP